MICPKCQCECPDSATFCGKCGAALQPAPVMSQNNDISVDNIRPDEQPANTFTSETTPTVQQVDTPAQPVIPPVQPAAPPVQPIAPPIQQAVPPVQPMTPPVQQTAPVQQFVPAAAPNSFDNFYGAPAPKKKKGFKPVPLIITLGIIAVITALVIIFFPFFKNQYRNLFYSNEKYMAAVLNEDIDKFSDDFSGNYGRLSDPEEFNGDGSIAITISDKGRDLIESFSGEKLPDLESATIKFKNAVKGNKAYISADAKINGSESITANAVVDDGSVYIQSDLLDDNYYEVPVSDSSAKNALKSIGEISDILPDKGTVNKLTKKYGKIATSHFENVEKSKEKVEFGDLKKDAVKLSAKLDKDLAYDVASDLLKTAKNDEDVKKIITKIAGSDLIGEDGDDTVDEYEKAIDEALGKLDKDGFAKFDGLDYSLTVYVDSFGEIICRTIKLGTADISIYSIEDGKKIAYGIVCNYNGENVSVTATGEKSGDKASGNISVSYAGLSMKLAKFENVDCHDIKSGKISGKIIISGSDFPVSALESELGKDFCELIKSAEIVCDFKLDKSDVDFSLKCSSNGTELIKYEMSHDGTRVSVPTVKNAKSINDIPSSTLNKAREKLQKILASIGGNTADKSGIYNYNDFDGIY